jgi:hypothetical protein
LTSCPEHSGVNVIKLFTFAADSLEIGLYVVHEGDKKEAEAGLNMFIPDRNPISLGPNLRVRRGAYLCEDQILLHPYSQILDSYVDPPEIAKQVAIASSASCGSLRHIKAK